VPPDKKKKIDDSPEKSDNSKTTEEEKKSADEAEGEDPDSGAERTNNPFKNAFNNFEYQEPNEEEIKASQEMADKYMKEFEEEEKEWFIKQEQDLLKQLMDDFHLEEYLGELDENTIKAIYDGIDPPSEPYQSVYTDNTKQEELFFAENMQGAVEDEVRLFAEDPSLQLLIQYQIQAEQEEKAKSEYQFDKQDFPSLIPESKMKEINRKKAFKLSDWKKTKLSNSPNKSGDILEEEAINKIKKAFPSLNTDI